MFTNLYQPLSQSQPRFRPQDGELTLVLRLNSIQLRLFMIEHNEESTDKILQDFLPWKIDKLQENGKYVFL